MTGAVKVNKILKWLFGLVAVCIVAVVGFLSWVSHELLYDPICDNWHTGMTKEEKIMLVLEAANREPKLVFEIKNTEGKVYLGRGRQIPYPDVDSILKTNPDCCKLVSAHTADTKHPSEKLPENDEGILMLRYKGQYHDNAGQIYEAPVVLRQNLNLCKN